MKKIYAYIVLLTLVFSGVIGCSDNTNTWTEHILTQAELDELARQDSIRKDQLSRINADLILEYTTEVLILNSGYEGSYVYIDTVQIAELFEITPTELSQGIQNMGSSKPYENAPEIVGFYIQGSTRQDVMEATNTNSYWGHWWDVNGDRATWNDGKSVVFAEYNAPDGYFHVGQMDGGVLKNVLDADKNVMFIECLKYNDLRVAVVITVIPVERGEVEAGVVNTQELNITVVPKNGYEVDLLAFDFARTLTDLGISSLDEAAPLAVNKDGSYAQETNAGTRGFWYDMDGFAGSWGDDASVYTSLETDDDGNPCLGIGQMPNVLSRGEEYVIHYGFMANDKIEMLKITITIPLYNDPETPPAGDPQDIEENINITKPFDNGYSRVDVDVKELLRNAFKMTTFQIFSAMRSGDLRVYMQEASEEAPSYTGGVAGEYWINAEGASCPYAEGVIYTGLYASETSLIIGTGNHPTNCDSNGMQVNARMIITYNGTKAVLNIVYNITASE